MNEVKDQRITNTKLRRRLDIRSKTEYAQKRQLNYMEFLAKKIKPSYKEEANNKEERNKFKVQKLLFAWSDHSRRGGQPQRTYRVAYKESLTQIYPTLPKDGDFKVWREDVEKGIFRQKTNEWWNSIALKTAEEHRVRRERTQRERIETVEEASEEEQYWHTHGS